MKIILNYSSMIPIYTQIVEQIKSQISDGTIKANDALPSVRELSKDLKISALTVKKAYDELEALGLTATIHGKGSYVKEVNKDLVLEKSLKEIEQSFEEAINKARLIELTDDEIRNMFEMLME
ncbi:MAG: GntR family transcriptional regulator [Lachnospiraceae bacterium]|nr:GntR family transcriptional regulator [Lachnospiraceae bacterium]